MKKAKFRNYLLMDLKRLFTGKPFFISVIGIWGINILNVLDEITVVEQTTVLYLFNGRSVVGAFEMLLIFFAVLPYCTSFCVDWDYGYYKSELIRGKNKWEYAVSKLCAAVIGTVIATCCGYLLFVLALRAFFPLFPETAEDLTYYMQLTPTAFQEAAFSDIPQLYYLVTILPEAFMYGFLASFALYMSSRDTNRFVVLSAPIIFYYIYNYLSGTLRLPSFLSWQFHETGVLSGVPWEMNLAATAGYYLIWTAAAGVLFVNRVRRRVQSGC